MRDALGTAAWPARGLFQGPKGPFLARNLAGLAWCLCLVLAGLLWPTAGASAQTVYRCTGPGGAVVFQQGRCGGDGGQRVEVRPANVVESQPVPASLQRDAAMRSAIARGEIVTGMTAAEVHQVLGLPQAVNSSAGTYGTRDQLVYRYPDGSARFVYLRDGQVDAVSTRSGSGRRVPTEPCHTAQEIRNARVGAESNVLPPEERHRRRQEAEEMARCRR